MVAERPKNNCAFLWPEHAGLMHYLPALALIGVAVNLSLSLVKYQWANAPAITISSTAEEKNNSHSRPNRLYS